MKFWSNIVSPWANLSYNVNAATQQKSCRSASAQRSCSTRKGYTFEPWTDIDIQESLLFCGKRITLYTQCTQSSYKEQFYICVVGMSIAYRRASSLYGWCCTLAKVDDDMGKKIRKRIAIYSAFIFGGKSYSVEYKYLYSVYMPRTM